MTTAKYHKIIDQAYMLPNMKPHTYGIIWIETHLECEREDDQGHLYPETSCKLYQKENNDPGQMRKIIQHIEMLAADYGDGITKGHILAIYDSKNNIVDAKSFDRWG